MNAFHKYYAYLKCNYVLDGGTDFVPTILLKLKKYNYSSETKTNSTNEADSIVNFKKCSHEKKKC